LTIDNFFVGLRPEAPKASSPLSSIPGKTRRLIGMTPKKCGRALAASICSRKAISVLAVSRVSTHPTAKKEPKALRQSEGFSRILIRQHKAAFRPEWTLIRLLGGPKVIHY
jgi:hypothetical protein